MQHSDFLNLKLLAGIFVRNKSTNETNELVSWLQLKWLRFERAKPHMVQYKYSLTEDEQFKELNCSRSPRAHSSEEPTTLSQVKLAQMYEYRLPISVAKKKDLLQLLKDEVIPDAYRAFYENLPTSMSARDTLPMRDIHDPDTDTHDESDGGDQTTIHNREQTNSAVRSKCTTQSRGKNN